MRIALHYPGLLPPKDYGGIERVVLWLASALRDEGHEVSLAALEGSRPPAGVRLLALSSEDSALEEFLRKLPAGTELIHFHSPPEPAAWTRLPCPGLLTVHGNGQPGEVFPVNSVFLSADHARRHRGEVFVHNGVDPSEYLFEPSSKRREFLFLSKTSWRVKNLAGAIRLCRKSGARLAVAGGERPWMQRLRVGLDPRMRWIGPVGGRAKAELLAEARALVFPVRWPEPFGLVMVEALMSGTPVLAAARGSVPEIVTPDVGAALPFPGSPEAESLWIEALSRDPLPWQPETCRKWALEKFNHRRMAQSYLELYRKVIGGAPLHEAPPVAGDWRQE